MIDIAKHSQSWELAQLAKRSFDGYPFEAVYDHKKVEDSINNGELRYVFTNNSGAILGTAVLGVENETDMSEIKRVMVDPEYRANGVATQLTKSLSEIAIGMGRIPYADVRGDQIGMQRSALNAGMRAISLEKGKHVVYSHGKRETMVHVTSIKFDNVELLGELSKIPNDIRLQLATNMENSLKLKQGEYIHSRQRLTSASETKRNILNSLLSFNNGGDSLKIVSEDVVIWSSIYFDAVFILPDASVFISTNEPESIENKFLEGSGIQVATIYSQMSDQNLNKKLLNLGYNPSSIRPWSINKKIAWQIGWQAKFNNYDESLQNINLDDRIENQIRSIITLVKG